MQLIVYICTAAAAAACRVALQLPQGSGPFGLLMPGDVAGVVQGAQAALNSSGPQLQALLQQPGASELLSDVSRQLAQRFAARAIKFTFGFTANLQAPQSAQAGATSS